MLARGIYSSDIVGVIVALGAIRCRHIARIYQCWVSSDFEFRAAKLRPDGVML